MTTKIKTRPSTANSDHKPSSLNDERISAVSSPSGMAQATSLYPSLTNRRVPFPLGSTCGVWNVPGADRIEKESPTG